MQEILEVLKGHDQLIDVIKYVVNKCNGEIEVDAQSDYDDDKDLITLSVYSEYFSKKQLDVLFKYTHYYNEIIYRPRKQKMEITLDVVVNKSL